MSTSVIPHSKNLISYNSSSDGWVDITVPPEMVEQFKLMVTRASLHWQNMSPEMIYFVDCVVHGRSLIAIK